MSHFLVRVAEWNSKRYDQVYDRNLALALVKEELQEYYDATNDTDRLDALGDIAFVCAGVLWKLQPFVGDYDTLFRTGWETTLDVLAVFPLRSITLVEAYVKHATLDNPEDAVMVYAGILVTAMFQLQELGLTIGQAERVVLAICDSNDTKSIPRKVVDPAIKANIDKGPYFVPPTVALDRILAEVRNAIN